MKQQPGSNNTSQACTTSSHTATSFSCKTTAADEALFPNPTTPEYIARTHVAYVRWRATFLPHCARHAASSVALGGTGYCTLAAAVAQSGAGVARAAGSRQREQAGPQGRQHLEERSLRHRQTSCNKLWP
jgi:hypothetical protein